ncbi:MAG: heme biosynthesis protein HemY [Rhizobiales bacterium 62-17]|nr:iron-sulfur cluster insertion protein ErpA [Hyphomicrobiales bacterium]OJY05855.1 MAG: heme biosynthesis protein HemY [Rhizobiales bacterium 62-17]
MSAIQNAESTVADTALPIVTDRAAKRVSQILSKEPDGAMLRVAVKGGGCSGFQYAFEIETAKADDDLVIEKNGVRVLVDPVSVDFLKGARIDFVDDLIGQSFKIDNPNVSASCGCGVSFSI